MRRQADDRIKADCKCTEFHVIKNAACVKRKQEKRSLTRGQKT
ncbi:hypothetical protein HMPREF3212_03962 [Citrobacter freundii]|nr:hypothetical protein HMPREF3212_03962 [Citrobacter freundii]